MPSDERPIVILKIFENWNPFPNEEKSRGKTSSVNKNKPQTYRYQACSVQVFFAAVEQDDVIFMYWILNGQIQLTWIKFQAPAKGQYQFLHACLCPGMSKLVGKISTL